MSTKCPLFRDDYCMYFARLSLLISLWSQLTPPASSCWVSGRTGCLVNCAWGKENPPRNVFLSAMFVSEGYAVVQFHGDK